MALFGWGKQKRQPPNYARSISIVGTIGQGLTSILAPQILRLRAMSNDPIVLLIDSRGGTTYDADVLWHLLTDPNREGKRPQLTGIAMARACSAAAVLLSRCDHAIVYPHSQVHFHGVRVDAERLTEEGAEEFHTNLRQHNTRQAVQLAQRVFHRVLDNYAMLSGEFDRVRRDYAEHLEGMVVSIPSSEMDLTAYAIALNERLSEESSDLVRQSFAALEQWYALAARANLGAGSSLALNFPSLADSLPAERRQRFDVQFSILTTICGDYFETAENEDLSAEALRSMADVYEYALAVADPEFRDEVLDVLTQHPMVFFDKVDLDFMNSVKDVDIEAKPESQARFDEAVENAYKKVKPLWSFVLSLCRSLSMGENPLSGEDAWWLGLVDEVQGTDLRRAG